MFKHAFVVAALMALFSAQPSHAAGRGTVEKVFEANLGSHLGRNLVTGKYCVVSVHRDSQRKLQMEITFSASPQGYSGVLKTGEIRFRKKWFKPMLVSKKDGLRIEYRKKNVNGFGRVTQLSGGKVVNDCVDMTKAGPEYIHDQIFGTDPDTDEDESEMDETSEDADDAEDSSSGFVDPASKPVVCPPSYAPVASCELAYDHPLSEFDFQFFSEMLVCGRVGSGTPSWVVVARTGGGAAQYESLLGLGRVMVLPAVLSSAPEYDTFASRLLTLDFTLYLYTEEAEEEDRGLGEVHYEDEEFGAFRDTFRCTRE